MNTLNGHAIRLYVVRFYENNIVTYAIPNGTINSAWKSITEIKASPKYYNYNFIVVLPFDVPGNCKKDMCYFYVSHLV